MYSSENLWPEKIASPDPSAPKIILEKQAHYFNAMMKNTIIARVLTSIDGTSGSSKPKIMHNFSINMPSFGKYELTLFWVTHGLHTYPSSIYDSINEQEILAENEEDLKFKLRQIFASPSLNGVIASLRSQIGNYRDQVNEP
jgi:hypothetical protein